MRAPAKAEVLAFSDPVTPHANLQMGQLNETLTETNKHLGSIVTIARDTLKFLKQLAWWSVLVVGVAWPTAGKIISGLPPLPT